MSAIKWTDRIGRRLKLNDLHTFLTVAELGSMGKAAERLGISQPSVSKAIADIEHAIGMRLLDRTATGVEITPYGRALLRRGLGAFDELRQGIQDISFLNDPTRGEVRVECPEAIASGILVQILDQFCSHHPRMTIAVSGPNNMPDEFSQLRKRKVDLWIGGVAQPFREEDLDAEVLYDDQLLIVSGSKSRWANRREIDLEELLDEPWLLPADNLFGSRVTEAFKSKGLPIPKFGVKSYSVYQRIHLVASGRFLAIQAGSVLHRAAEHFSLKVLPVDLQAGPWPISIVTLKNRTVTPAVQMFIDLVRDIARPMTKPHIVVAPYLVRSSVR
jgi:DNA-binding transcriptional LysR family regulator